MRPRRWLLAAVAALAVVATAGAVASATGGPHAPRIAVPTLDWGACPPAPAHSASVDGFECATAVVPMDYTHPRRGTFALAVIKHPAEDPGHRIGTVLFNPGGPSDAGTEFLPAVIGGFPERVRQRFDIVSWDPRGMGGRTTPVVQCFDSADQEAAFLASQTGPAIPVSVKELTARYEFGAAFNRQCAERNGDLLRHVSTADNARDLDLLRQAVGEARITYYGTSYGTFLGATYVSMFPKRVRAVVLDGAVAPRAWAGNDGDGAPAEHLPPRGL